MVKGVVVKDRAGLTMTRGAGEVGRRIAWVPIRRGEVDQSVEEVGGGWRGRSGGEGVRNQGSVGLCEY